MTDLKALVTTLTGNLLCKCFSSWMAYGIVLLVMIIFKSKYQRALAKICLNVLPCCYSHVRNATTSKEAWDGLQLSFKNKSLCRRLSLQRRLYCRLLPNVTKIKGYTCVPGNGFSKTAVLTS